ncbi:LLM class F420-dependent oxidoreductase [Nocardia sp. GCM10030253]|uniref:LLM class F420-dependent oxidoreductase n=1 Tax=Nocardia sp. GCM10030253 TaxID=3273404 RepID=UPI00362554EE
MSSGQTSPGTAASAEFPRTARLSVSLPYWQDRDPLETMAVADAADKLGFDQLWIGEMATFDAFALATAIGSRTRDIDLCVGPLAVDIRTPATIAIGVASVAALTGRRVDVAIGASSTVVVGDWHGRERRRTAAHLEDTARILRGLLDGGKVDYLGVVERTRGYRLRLPAPGSSITIAAFGARALDCAARVADRVVLNLVTPEQVARCAQIVRGVAERAGRPCPRIAVWVTAAADPTVELLATLRRGIVGYLAAPGYADMFSEAGYSEVVALARSGAHPREVLAAVPDALAATIGMFGDEATVKSRLAEYRSAGADEIVAVPATATDDPAGIRTLEMLARLGHE